MIFIGIIASKHDIKAIKKKMEDANITKDIELVEINEKSMDNVKNVMFDSLIITEQLAKINYNEDYLSKICSSAKNIVINTDYDYDFKINVENKNIITYGCNQKATVTISSISEDKIIISAQREFHGNSGNKIEIGEKCLKINSLENIKIYNLLIMFIILMLYK